MCRPSLGSYALQLRSEPAQMLNSCLGKFAFQDYLGLRLSLFR